MKLQKAIQILTDHNIWRRGADTEQTNPTKLGISIDTILSVFKPKEAEGVVKLHSLEKGYFITVTDHSSNQIFAVTEEELKELSNILNKKYEED